MKTPSWKCFKLFFFLLNLAKSMVIYGIAKCQTNDFCSRVKLQDLKQYAEKLDVDYLNADYLNVSFS